jgi:hypothetical protein
MRTILCFLLSLLTWQTFLFGQEITAVKLNISEQNKPFWKQNAKPIHDDWFLIETNIPEEYQGFRCEIRMSGSHFCFESNRLIVRIRNSPTADDWTELSSYGNVRFPFANRNLLTIETDAKDVHEIRLAQSALQQKSYVEHVQIDQFFRIDATTNDPLYVNQWHLENTGSPVQFNGTVGADVDAPSAWNFNMGDSVIVAVMDSGIDTLHPEFTGRLLPGFDAFATATSDTKGYPALDFPENAHGTACAGIIGAEQDNQLGGSGIAPHVKLVPVRMFTYITFQGQTVPFTNMTTLLAGISYSADSMNADIISCSAGLTDEYISLLNIDTIICNQEIRNVHALGRNGKGTILFFSAGNDNINLVIWPANLPETIAVGASNMCDRRKSLNDCSPETWWGSSYGPTLDLVAPGVKIATCDITSSLGYANGDYTLSFNGTSAACPLAAGIGALLLSENPALTAEEVRHILNATAERVSTYTYDSLTIHGTWNEEMGHGRINAHLALQQVFDAGGNELAHNMYFDIFPNPASDVLVMRTAKNSNIAYSISSTDGTKVLEGTAFNVSNVPVMVENLASGMYIIIAEIEGMIVRKSFLIQ